MCLSVYNHAIKKFRHSIAINIVYSTDDNKGKRKTKILSQA